MFYFSLNNIIYFKIIFSSTAFIVVAGIKVYILVMYPK